MIDLEPFRGSIEKWLAEGHTKRKIAELLAAEGVHIKQSALKQKISKMGLGRVIRRPIAQAYDIAAVRERILYHFHSLRVTDEMGTLLLQRDGFDIGKWQYQNERQSLGLLKRTPAEASAGAKTEVEGKQRREMDEGHVEDLPRRANDVLMSMQSDLDGSGGQNR